MCGARPKVVLQFFKSAALLQPPSKYEIGGINCNMI